MNEITAESAATTDRTASDLSRDDVDRRRAARFRAGDDSAFDEIVAVHQDRIARLVFRLLGWRDDVEDVVQEVFVAALTNLPRFRGDAKLSTWLTAIAVNQCRSRQRRWLLWRRHWQRFVERQEEFDSTKTHTSEPDSHQAVRDAVRRLPANYREPIVLFYFEQMTAAEAAEALGLAVGTVEVRLTRARKRLKEILQTEIKSRGRK